MKELVDKKEAGKMIDEAEINLQRGLLISKEQVRIILEKCILSPAELGGILKGKAWVLEKLKNGLKLFPPKQTIEGLLVLKNIESLESLSPAELGSDSWVLKELKKNLKIWKLHAEKNDQSLDIRAIEDVQDKIEELEDQAPVSELAKEIEEDRRKVGAWDELYNRVKNAIEVLKPEASKDAFGKLALNQVQLTLETMDELLAQSEIPPKAEEESDEEISGD